MTTGLSDYLANTLSQDLSIRANAERTLAQLSEESFPQYTVALCQELANERNIPGTRQAAGLLFKNAVSAKDLMMRGTYADRWLQMDAGYRTQIKASLLQTLDTAVPQAASAAAAAIHAVAEIELPAQLWDDLIATLCDNVQRATGGPVLKEFSLQTLGYICETIDQAIFQNKDNPNKILTAIAHGARKDELNTKVRHAAIRALINSLEFAKSNFENPMERNYIMQMVCEATQCQTDDELVASAFECLVKIMFLYYEFMSFYMEQALIALTLSGMKLENDKIALQAIEFWSTVCEEESIRIQDKTLCYNFSKIASKNLVDVLVFLMTKKDAHDDEDEWNVPMAAATCLSFLANAVQNDILGLIVPWIQKQLLATTGTTEKPLSWRSILDGLSDDAIMMLVQMAFPSLIKIMQEDPNVLVKDTAAWALGRICEKLDAKQLGAMLTPLIEVVLKGLNDQPRVATNCAWCIMQLAERVEKEGDGDYPLLPFFEHLIRGLLESAEKLSEEVNVKATAYEAIASLCYNSVVSLLTGILTKLEQTVLMQNEVVNNDDRMTIQEQQANLCSVLTNIIRRLGQSISPFSDNIMQLLLQMLSTASKNSTVHEDVFIVVTVEQFFERYMEQFKPFLLAALQNPGDAQLSAIAVGLVGDICRALNARVIPHCNEFMLLLVQNLQSDVLDRTVKPAILSCFGDIALAIGGHFDQYASVLPTLSFVMDYAKVIQDDSPEEIDYYSVLREGILEAFVGIVQGLHSENKDTFPERTLAQYFKGDWVDRVLKDLRKSANPKNAELSKWAKSKIKRHL
ncbi:armadillo-type protein [Chytridium lagenaria]|nr:armadillo-type protein [Chytridium lagenaria]